MKEVGGCVRMRGQKERVSGGRVGLQLLIAEANEQEWRLLMWCMRTWCQHGASVNAVGVVHAYMRMCSWYRHGVRGDSCIVNYTLTRSLPRDVYIRRQNDHPGGQGRIYTSHLNFVSTHLSKPGHRHGCCCMSPRCLLRQFVDRCLLFWAFFIEKTVLLCFARFLSKWRETALRMFPDATSWYELYVWWLSLRRRSRREMVSSCWKRRRRMTVDICWERKLVMGAPGGKMTTLLL